jgi:hypothetical protein
MPLREKHHFHDVKNKERKELVYIREIKEKIFFSTLTMNHQAKISSFIIIAIIIIIVKW